MGMVDHDPLADLRGRVDVDAENLAHPHLEEIGQITVPLFPQEMPDAIGLNRLIAFEIQDRLHQPVAGRITLIHRHQIGARSVDQIG